MKNILYTIGHSTHSVNNFIELLSQHNITAVCDVRSSPYSQYVPQYNRETIRSNLQAKGIAYVFLGMELGAKSNEPGCIDERGQVNFEQLAQTALFREGIKRLIEGMKSYTIALMCAEKDPLECHRTILICRNLRLENIKIEHIHEDGTIENHSDLENRLLRKLKMQPTDLFQSTEEVLAKAYAKQGSRIAFITNGDDTN